MKTRKNPIGTKIISPRCFFEWYLLSNIKSIEFKELEAFVKDTISAYLFIYF
jgi:hypothetical protein